MTSTTFPTRTTSFTAAAGVALLALTGCVSLSPGESQVNSNSSSAEAERANHDQPGASLTHPVEDGEVIAHMLDARETLETLRTEMVMTFELDALWAAQDQRLEMTTEGAEDFSEAFISGTVAEDGEVLESFEAYVQDGQAIPNTDGAGWEQDLDMEPEGSEDDSRYSRVAQGIGELEQLLEVDFDGAYRLSYRGSDREVFDAFEAPFSLTLDGYEPEDTEMTVDVAVDPETFYVEEFSFTLHTKDSTGPISLGMEIGAEYSQFNEIPALEIPEDVLEEAYGSQE